MAAVAQYYSDNLRTEVLKGIDEKVCQGWPSGLAPYGYINVEDREEPIKPHPIRSNSVQRIFELYSLGNLTFEKLADQLAAEGHIFRDTQARFHRTAISYILNNRFYIGELRRKGHVYEGKYTKLIDRRTFELCQDVLAGKNRRTGNTDLPFAGGLITCAYCGQSITGERIMRKLKGGGVREHVYYRCANNRPGADHPKVRWRSNDLEMAIIKDLQRMRLPTPEIAAWFRESLAAAFADVTAAKRRQVTSLTKRKPELATMQDRLLNAYLAGTIDEATYAAKSAEIKGDLMQSDETLEQLNSAESVDSDLGLRHFEWSQNMANLWLGSNISQKREILDLICLNRTLSDVSLVLVKRKPFDFLFERLSIQSNRGDRIRTCDLLHPMQAR
jgi:site-specific DNA recombinase